MKSFFLFTIFSLAAVRLFSHAYFVSPAGSDANPGSEVRPFRTIQTAANRTQPGDTVYVMQGIYTEYLHAGATISIQRSGEPDAYIVYRAYPGHTPKIVSPTWNAFDVRDGVAYIEINGFEIEGQPHAMSDSSGNGIFCSGGAHHIRILSNHVYNVPGGGIGSSGCDYLFIEGNIVHHTSFYSGYQNSGISLYQNRNFDETPGYHNIIRNNMSYANENRRLPLWGGDKVTDGNGIIIDDFRNEQGGGPHVPYTAATLIENNIVFDNGGRGIHCYLSDHVVIVNNTLYKNSRSPDIEDGELTAMQSSDIHFVNNIVYAADTGSRGNKTWQAMNTLFDYNLYFNTRLLSVRGEHDIRDQDPLFVNATTDPHLANFRLQPESPAIDAGCSDYIPENDITGGPRIMGNGLDLGAFESPYTSQVENTWHVPQSHLLLSNFPNPFNGSTTISFALPLADVISLDIYDSRGRHVQTLLHGLAHVGSHTVSWPGTVDRAKMIKSGVYFIRLATASGHRAVKKAMLLK
ncbi:right-handed parallel beta-helix repeat-containing protein [candidate division KSB1 bacterium]|nr:right-handed parallel beta-helix repeat-containing protein [candidate division KSB1 bacterium]